jgi:hypothetical protein
LALLMFPLTWGDAALGMANAFASKLGCHLARGDDRLQRC